MLLKKHPKRAVRSIKSPAIGYVVIPHANTLTGLIPSLYAGLDVVSRELVGFLPSVARNPSAERAAVGQNVTWHVAPVATVGDTAPAMATPEPTDKTVAANTMTITKSRQTSFGWIGEEVRGLDANGAGASAVQADLFAQGLRALVNEMEVDIGTEAAAKASRAYGAAATVPFASNVGESAQLKKILDDNGAPASERSLIINTTTGANYRTLANLTKVNEAGTAMTLRDGELINLHGFSIKESAGVFSHTAGTLAGSPTTNNAGYAIGATTITLASAGTGSIVAGDVISFDGDTSKYVVVTGDADVSGGGTVVIAAPGLRKAIPASTTAITLVASCSRQIAFSRNALVLATRAPALPPGGDIAMDRTMIMDPRSGMVFEISVYPGYRKIRLEVANAWGVKAVKTEHIAALLGPI